MSATETAKVRRRYDRIAPGYDLMEWVMERRSMSRWREYLWSRVEGQRILEIGVGTGKNIPYHPPDAEVVGIDLSPRMLERARRKAEELESEVDLREMDAENLDFPDSSFDAVVTTCVFCSVPEAVNGLREAHRVLRPDGRMFMLEHVLSGKRMLEPAMHAVDPMVVRMMGAHINRQTRRNLEAAGFVIEVEENLWLDIVKLFMAKPS